MGPTALLLGLDVDQAEACRSALGPTIKVMRALDAEDAVALLSLHRSPLVIVRTDVHSHQRRVLAELAARVGARVASVSEGAQPAAIEHLIEGLSSIAFGNQRETYVQSASGIRTRVTPGGYGIRRAR